MVPPRYGSDLVGGAENLVGALARRAHAAGWHVDIATTCAVDNERWANTRPPGETVEDGLVVRRFPVSPRDERRHHELAGRLNEQGTLSALDEVDLLSTSVWSEDLQQFIDTEAPGYHAVVFAPYLLGTTFWGAQSWPERTAIIPCLHDEPQAHLPSVQRVLRGASTLLFNAPGEERLARRLLGHTGGAIVGMGFDTPTGAADATFATRHGLDRYVVYMGRLEEGKRVHIAAQYVADFARRYDDRLRLVVVGRGSWQPSEEVAPYVTRVGFLPEDEKRAALAGAVALVNPSELESLSIVLLEGWLEGTPAIVAAGSEVMRDHCTTSRGGFTFTSQAEFDRALSQLLGDGSLRAEMGARGRDYVHAEYAWTPVLGRLERALAPMARSS